jgi:hypothetical protein
MTLIREQQLEYFSAKGQWEHVNGRDPRCGAEIALAHISEQLMTGKMSWRDLPPAPVLARFYCRDKKTNEPIHWEDSRVKKDFQIMEQLCKRLDAGESRDVLIREEGASTATTMGSFIALTSQLYFNAVVGGYEHADMVVAKTFRTIPSTLLRGEIFAGVGGLAKLLSSTGEGRDLPHLSPTEDYTQTPAQRKVGAVVDVTWELATADRTGEILRNMETLGEAIGVTREMEACGTVLDIDPITGASGYVRTRYNWKPQQGVSSTYATYAASGGVCVNSQVNILQNQDSINTAYVLMTKVVDPWTGLPISMGPGAFKMFVAPDLKFLAQRIARSTQYMTTEAGTLNADFAPQVWTDGGTVIDFEVVASAYIGALIDANVAITGGGAGYPTRQSWWIGKPDRSFCWPTAQELITQDAIPGAGEMFQRVLEKQIRAFDCKTAYCENPRYMQVNLAA